MSFFTKSGSSPTATAQPADPPLNPSKTIQPTEYDSEAKISEAVADLASAIYNMVKLGVCDQEILYQALGDTDHARCETGIANPEPKPEPELVDYRPCSLCGVTQYLTL
jgi:hypothetical protein